MNDNGAIEIDVLRKYESAALLRVTERLQEPASLNLLSSLQKMLKLGYKDFIIDLSQIDSVSSSGLGSISYCQKEIGLTQGRLVVVCVNEKIKKLFEVTRLDGLIQMADSFDEASGYLAKGEEHV